jgi:hypothetical protein
MKDNHYAFMICSLIAGFLVLNLTIVHASGSEHRMSRNNIVWNTPSKDATGRMLIVNGDIAARVRTIENGDLFFDHFGAGATVLPDAGAEGTGQDFAVSRLAQWLECEFQTASDAEHNVRGCSEGRQYNQFQRNARIATERS